MQMWEKMTPVWENTLTSSYVKWSSRTGAWWWGCVGWHTEYIYFTHGKVANPVGAAACHRLTMQIGSNLVNKYVSAGERTSYILTQLRPRQSVHFYPPVLFVLKLYFCGCVSSTAHSVMFICPVEQRPNMSSDENIRSAGVMRRM